MFTGLIEATGRLEPSLTATGGTIVVRTTMAGDLSLGESVSVNGCCLTVTTRDADSFGADVSPVTAAVTSLGTIEPGRLVNLERAVQPGARMGGHFVLGHVDATGRIAGIRREGDSYWFEVDVPATIEPLLIPRGSVAVDGISLTVARLSPGRMALQIIPFTFAHTSLANAGVGDTVNLEGDVLGKYVARLLETQFASAVGQAPGSVTP